MRLSPVIRPTVYRRLDNAEAEPVAQETYRVTHMNTENARGVPEVTVPDDDLVLHHGSMGGIVLYDTAFHVPEPVYRGRKLVVLREMCANAMETLAAEGVCEYERID